MYYGGDLGYIENHRIFFRPQPQGCNLSFSVNDLDSLPRVEILGSYAGDGLATAAKALIEQGTRGLVIAGSGAGSIHAHHKSALKKAHQRGRGSRYKFEDKLR
ncbi:hypothetical protein [Helicobacter typhlonius]